MTLHSLLIFNRETLKSPDEVSIGQKLLIPPLEGVKVEIE
jgi:hypothetical protein